MLDAFHCNWTKPYMKMNCCKEYKMEDYNILLTILSALEWRQNNGSIQMITDEIGAEFYYKRNMESLWDKGIKILFADLNNQNIDPNIFWAAGKIYALNAINVPAVSIDTDMIVWNNIDNKVKDTSVSVIHKENINLNIYPEKNYFKNNSFVKRHNEFDWTVLPCNTAFMYISDNKFKDYYVKTAIEFMKSSNISDNHIVNMVFAEQRLLSMCAKNYGISINEIYTIKQLFNNEQKDFTHIWGEKYHLENNYNYRELFCIRCLSRILNDFPCYEKMISQISELNEIYNKYYSLIQNGL